MYICIYVYICFSFSLSCSLVQARSFRQKLVGFGLNELANASQQTSARQDISVAASFCGTTKDIGSGSTGSYDPFDCSSFLLSSVSMSHQYGRSILINFPPIFFYFLPLGQESFGHNPTPPSPIVRRPSIRPAGHAIIVA